MPDEIRAAVAADTPEPKSKPKPKPKLSSVDWRRAVAGGDYSPETFTIETLWKTWRQTTGISVEVWEKRGYLRFGDDDNDPERAEHRDARRGVATLRRQIDKLTALAAGTTFPAEAELARQKREQAEVQLAAAERSAKTSDDERVREEYRNGSPEQVQWALNQVWKSSGMIQRAHALPGLPGILPQLKWDNPSDPACLELLPFHYHPWAQPEGYVPCNPKTGKPLRPSRCKNAWEMRRHILSKRRHHPEALAAAARHGYGTPKNILQLLADADREPAKRQILEDLLEEAAPAYAEEHQTLRERKFLFTPKRRIPWEHDHDVAYAYKPRREDPAERVFVPGSGRVLAREMTGEQRKERAAHLRRQLDKRRARHLNKHHGGQEVPGFHDHGKTTIEDDSDDQALRIDVNPLALPRFAAARVVFAEMEGKQKADAILTYVIEHHLPASVFDVPAVWLWDAVELPYFVERYLAGKLVVVVPDADARENPAVMSSALLFRSRLEDLGLVACIAAPPDERDEKGELRWKGPDDHLGDGGDLLDWPVFGLVAPEDGLRAWAERRAKMTINGRRVRMDAVKRDLRTLRGLILLAGTIGQATQPSLGKVARYIHQDVEAVGRAVEALLEMPEPPISVEDPRSAHRGEPGSLETKRWHVVTSVKRPNRKPQLIRDRDFDFENRPIFTIVDPRLRAVECSEGRLADWLAPELPDVRNLLEVRT